MSLEENILKILEKKNNQDILLITLTSKQSENIYSSSLSKERYQRIYNKLLNYKYQNTNILKYKYRNKTMSLFGDKKEIYENKNITYNINNDYIMQMYKQNEISLIKFPCKQYYDTINQCNEVKFLIDDNLNIFCDDSNNKIYIKIKINAYIYESIKKLVSII